MKSCAQPSPHFSSQVICNLRWIFWLRNTRCASLAGREFRFAVIVGEGVPMLTCPFVHLILQSKGQKVPKSGSFKNEGIPELSITLMAALCAWQPALGYFYVLPWYALNYLISRYVDYLNHYACDEASTNPFERSNNSLSPSFNWLTNNFGYHTAHHLQPGAHWTELPEIHRSIADRIPQRCQKPFSWSIVMLPHHFYLSRKDRM